MDRQRGGTGPTGRRADSRDGRVGRKSIILNRGSNQMEGTGEERNTRSVNIGGKYPESISERRERNEDKSKK